MKLIAAYIALVFGIIAIGLYMRISVYNECRQDHSVLYCWMLASAR